MRTIPIASESTVTEVNRVIDVTWKCDKGHTNFAVTQYKDGEDNNFVDVCLKCGKHNMIEVLPLENYKL